MHWQRLLKNGAFDAQRLAPPNSCGMQRSQHRKWFEAELKARCNLDERRLNQVAYCDVRAAWLPVKRREGGAAQFRAADNSWARKASVEDACGGAVKIQIQASKDKRRAASLRAEKWEELLECGPRLQSNVEEVFAVGISAVSVRVLWIDDLHRDRHADLPEDARHVAYDQVWLQHGRLYVNAPIEETLNSLDKLVATDLQGCRG
mmetsp:Transcript_71672/g.135359  ORF Transcript_71672/g.135359 Transcript_71672/m.135359 type:complete len:205 (-) Transcript_71672:1942-2556(-)